MTTETKPKDSTVDFYDSHAEEYTQTRTTDPFFWKSEFDCFRDLIRGRTVIDIGCGNGRDAALFAKAHLYYLGIDASENMLAIARKKNPGVDFRLMNFFEMDFQSGAFYGFWAAGSLLHASKAELPDLLKSILKITKKGGIGFISVKEQISMSEGFESEPMFGEAKRFFAYYRPEEFKKALEKAGFEVVKSYLKSEDDPKLARWLCYFVKKV